MATIGLLALQGAFQKHATQLAALGADSREVRSPSDLDCCDGLILPGGESTTFRLLLKQTHLHQAIQSFGNHQPIFGTCAGLITMASQVEDEPSLGFNFLDITVKRNAYGRQAESFCTSLTVDKLPEKKLAGVFIRAPQILSVGPAVTVLASHRNQPVLVQQGLHIGASFHPELTNDLALHRYFLAHKKINCAVAS